jgi:hypothetical protein
VPRESYSDRRKARRSLEELDREVNVDAHRRERPGGGPDVRVRAHERSRPRGVSGNQIAFAPQRRPETPRDVERRQQRAQMNRAVENIRLRDLESRQNQNRQFAPSPQARQAARVEALLAEREAAEMRGKVARSKAVQYREEYVRERDEQRAYAAQFEAQEAAAQQRQAGRGVRMQRWHIAGDPATKEQSRVITVSEDRATGEVFTYQRPARRRAEA